MKSNYKRIGDFIQLVDERNTDLKVDILLGLSISKEFIPSVANTIGTNLANYKIVRKDQFACSLMQVRRDKKMPVAQQKKFDEAIISPAYPVFEVVDQENLLPEYLMMWMMRPEFDREACFYAVGGVRGSLEWDDFCDMKLPVPDIDKQRAVVYEYNIVVNRIEQNDQLIGILEETAQTIFHHWFVDFEFPDDDGHPYKSSGGEMEWNEEFAIEIPKNWDVMRVGQIATLKYGKMLDSSQFLSKGYPVYSGYGVRGYYSRYMYETPQILVICRGVGGTGDVKMSPPKSYITNLSIVVTDLEESIDKQFLFYFLRNANLRSLDSGSAQSQITIGDLERVFVLKPPQKYQRKFGDFMRMIKSKVDHSLKMTDALTQLGLVTLQRISDFGIK